MTEKVSNRPKSSEPSTFGKSYLLAYNSIQSMGWLYLLWQTIMHFLNHGTLDALWDEIKWTVLIFQNAAILEIINAAVGLVPSGVMVVFMQVYSRVFLVCGALLATHGATISPGLPLCMIAWSVTEVVRYGYYALNLLKIVPQFLQFLRYSTFLVLYPLGITGELLCMYHSLNEIEEKNLFTATMPNTWNFAFNYYYFIIFYMFLYVPLFPVLFGHMLSQRRKMLSREQKMK